MHRDFVSIATPEGLTIDLELAGPGSRSAAALIDHGIIAGLLFVTFQILSDTSAGGIGRALAAVITFGIIFGYFIVFEMAWRGQSPGKWLMQMQVLHDDGGAVGWRASIVRNVIRIIDFLPLFYVIGLLAVFGTTRDQRLGDLAAGTIVVRQLRLKMPPSRISFDLPRPEGWDITAVGEQEMAAVRHFLLRRDDLPPAVRGELAQQLSHRLGRTVVHPEGYLPPEQFLETVAGARLPGQ